MMKGESQRAPAWHSGRPSVGSQLGAQGHPLSQRVGQGSGWGGVLGSSCSPLHLGGPVLWDNLTHKVRSALDAALCVSRLSVCEG